MERARLAVAGALFVAFTVTGATLAAVLPSDGALAPVAWPLSSLLVSEVQTGGASASDEFVELTNAGVATVDLSGLEVVYVTSTGGTITRKASWTTSRLLAPGQHLLLANTSGAYASIADAAYSGGLAATGGAIVLRSIGGMPIDAIGWGDATNAFVEGAAAPAPLAKSSLERLPGGAFGNTTDTNDDGADWFIQSVPNPQNLAAPPVPAPGPTATLTPTPSPTPSSMASPSPTPSPQPTTTPTPAPTASPSDSPAPTPTESPLPSATDGAPSPSPEPSMEPSPSPTPAPTGTPTTSQTPSEAPTPIPTPSPAPTPAPTADPTPPPTPSPTTIPEPTATPAPSSTPIATVTIAAARAQADGTTATIVGTLTTRLGALESGRKGFVEDETAGIALYLDVEATELLPAGTLIRVSGTVDDRYAERTLRVSLASVVVLGSEAVPVPVAIDTGSAGEPLEGLLVAVSGTSIGSPSAYADGLGLLVDDGTGSVRVIVGADALGGLSVPAGTQVSAIGPIGQRDSSGTGTSGYRIHTTEVGELTVFPAPSPSPASSPSASPTASPTPVPIASATPAPPPSAEPSATPTPTPSPSPSAVPTATPAPTAAPSPTPKIPPTTSIAQARLSLPGTTVSVEGVVTAESGRLGTPPLLSMQDATGGIVVRVPDGIQPPGRGSRITVVGPLADPYGQLEMRPTSAGFWLTGSDSLPTAMQVAARDLGEHTEGSLVQLVGTARKPATKETSGDLAIDLVDPAGDTFRILCDASSRIASADLPVGRPLRVTGIAGQHATRKGALDGYRVWLRDRGDIQQLPAPGASPSPSGALSGTISVAAALVKPDGTVVAIAGTVTAGPALLDSSGRRIVVQDSTGAIEVVLPSASRAPDVGALLRVDGMTAHAWGAPRVKAATIAAQQVNTTISPSSRSGALTAVDEWRLVRLVGTIVKVERVGDRWRADLLLPGAGDHRVPILGQPGAAIPSTAVLVGRQATITGIVKRPYPTAIDQRFGLLPRSAADMVLGPATTGRTGNDSGSGPAAATSGAPDSTGDITPDTDLAALDEHVGERVRVGGLVDALGADGFDLDDGTAVAHVLVQGDASGLLGDLREGDALAATGEARLVGGAAVVVVTGAGDLVRVGDLGQALPLGTSPPSPAPFPSAAAVRVEAIHAASLGVAPPPVSLLAMAMLSLASLALTIFRRRARRRLRAAIEARLATLHPIGRRA